MVGEHRPRFKTAQDALRFFFRVHETVRDGPAGYSAATSPPADAFAQAMGAVDDYHSIGWCMRGLDEAEFFVLREIYGPAWFGPRRNEIERACEAGRRAYPWRKFTPRAVASLHRDAMGVVRRRLISLGMAPRVDWAPAPAAPTGTNHADLFRRSGFPVRLEFAGTPAKRIIWRR